MNQNRRAMILKLGATAAVLATKEAGALGWFAKRPEFVRFELRGKNLYTNKNFVVKFKIPGAYEPDIGPSYFTFSCDYPSMEPSRDLTDDASMFITVKTLYTIGGIDFDLKQKDTKYSGKERGFDVYQQIYGKNPTSIAKYYVFQDTVGSNVGVTDLGKNWETLRLERTLKPNLEITAVFSKDPKISFVELDRAVVKLIQSFIQI